MMIFRKRLLCVTVCLCMIFGMMPATAQAATGEDIRVSGETVKAYKIGDTSFNIKGVDVAREYWTTFLDWGYNTAVSVDGGKKRIKPGKLIASGLRLDVTLDKEGDNYVKVQYTLTNTGSKPHTVKVGSYADVMIDDNDRAPIYATEAGGNTLLMTGSPRNDYAFKLVAPTCDTLWYGYYGKCVKKCFTNMENRGPSNVYKKDSGISYSWNATVEPGKTWSRYVLIGTGSAEQMNVGTPTIPQPEEIIPEPEITLTTNELYFTEGESLPADWNSYIASSKGTVTVTGKPASTNTPGTYTVTYTATNKKGTKKEASLTVHILQKPAELSQASAINVTNTNKFTLTATMLQTGGVNWTETGFVYGALQNPTMTLNDGSVKTASAVNTKNGSIKAVATGLTEGITYYARVYAKASDGTIIYGAQSAGFGLNAPNYGTFQVTNSGSNTFTISRTGGTDGEQTVYYRTVNGSAVGGTHFTHKADSVTFAKGETSKSVTVTELGANKAYLSSTATAYTNAARTYQLEIYRVSGGAAIDGNKAKATRTMTVDTAKKVDRNIYNAFITIAEYSSEMTRGDYDSDKLGWTKNAKGSAAARTVPVEIKSVDSDYWRNTASAFKYYMSLDIKEVESGYQHIQVASGNSMDLSFYPKTGAYRDSSTNDVISNLNNYTAVYAMTLEHGGNSKDTSYKSYSFPSQAATTARTPTTEFIKEGKGDKKALLFPVDTKNITVGYGGSGSGSDKWMEKQEQHKIRLVDACEPQLVAIAPMAGGKYLQGDSVTVSLIFDEIVDSVNSAKKNLSSSSTIDTNWGTFKYAGGADTNVLYFTGTVPANAGSSIKLKTLDCASRIKDMCDESGTNAGFSDSPTTMVEVGKVAAPTVSIGTITNASGVLTGNITATNAEKLEYVWTKTSTVPAFGWRMLSNTTSSTVKTRQTSGTWYLHARATNSDGRTATAYKSVEIPATGSNTYAAPDLTVNANNSSWAKTRNITVTRSPGDATVTVKTPEGGSETVAGSSYTAKTNGVYTFTLTYNEETITRQVAVSRLDNTAPTVTINDLKNTAHADQVTLTFSVTDGGSGVKSVTAKWNDSGATLTKNGDGTYTTTCPNTTGSWKLTVTAADGVGNNSNKESKTYTVNLDKPVLTVTKTGSTKQGINYNYSVDDKGNEDVIVYLPDGTQTDKLNGTFTLIESGTYTIAVTDKAGHFVSKEITVPETVDGVAPEVRLYADDSMASDKLTVEVMVYEERGMPTVKQDSSALTVTADSEETGNYTGSFTVTEGGVYTVTATDEAGNTDNGSITVYALINGDNTTLKLPEADGTYGALPTPDERTGYTFDGWYTAETGGTKADSSMEVTAYKLYARWIPVTYEVTLIGDRDSGTDLTSYTFGKGAALPADWTKQCAKFDGWYTAATGGSKIDKIGADESGNKTYYARWKVEHRWNDATCTAPKTCSVCKITEGSALGHKYETAWSKDADKHWHKCSVCGDKTNEETHSWDKGTVTIQPGCTTAGTKTFGCICGATKTENIDAAGHTAGAALRKNEVAATCTTDGSYDEVIYCTVCKAEISRESKSTPATGHSFGAWTVVKEATCTAEGHETRVCSVCSAKEDKDIGKLSHTKSGWIKDENNHWKICTVCNAVIEDKTAHTFSNWVIDENATEATEGSRHRECIICGRVNREIIPALGHTHSFDREVTEHEYLKSEATCTTAAVYYKSCKCGEKGTETFTRGDALGHNFTVIQHDESQHWKQCSRCGTTSERNSHFGGVATCTEQPVCSECGQKYGIALGHDYVHHDAKAATCTEKGWETYDTCSRCDYTTYKETPAAGHTAGAAVRENEVAAICTSAGSYDEVIYCTVCKAEISRESKSTPATGHSFGAWTVVKEATCTAEGCEERVCIVCSAKEDKDIGKLSHTKSGWIKDENNHWKKCTVCDVIVGAKEEHVFGDWITDTPATENTAGSRHQECSLCKYKNTEIIPVLSHTHKYDKEATDEKYLKSAATCTVPAVYYKSCKCGEKGTETFEYGTVNPDNHTGGTEIRNASEANHVLQTKGYTGDTYCRGCNTKLSSGTEILPGDHIPESVWKMNENNHWKECSVLGCDIIIENTSGAHVYDGDGDADCNICGYTRTIIPIHKHSLEKVSAVAATCTSTGNTEHYKCEDCDKLFSDPAGTKEITAESVIVGMLPHSPKELPAIEATCENTGLSAGSKCENCDTIIIEQTVTAAKGHDFVSGIWRYDTAQHWKKCSRCDVTDTKENHVYDNEQDNICNVCGYNHDIIPVHIHNWAAEWLHDTAYHWHECLSSDCDVTENILKAGYAAHIEAAAVRENETAATCTTDGSYDEVVYCTDCHAEISRTKNITKALDHEWGNWVVTKPATSSEDGEEQRICIRDSSHVETKIIPALTHTHQYSEVVKDEYIKSAATCTEPAVYYKSCECGETSTDTFTSGNALGHDFIVLQHDENQHWKKCSRCDVTDIKSDHDYDSEQDNICNVCGYNRGIAPGHTHALIKVDGTPATCTEEGVKDYWKCSDCGKLFENEQGTAEITDTGIPAKGHSYSSIWSSDTACHWHQCIACCIAETDKAAHIWGTGVITTPATTTSEGVKTFTCEICKATKTESIAKIPSGGGVTPPKNDAITVDVTGDKTSVKITAEISGDTASIAEIGKNDIDKAGAGTDLIIDLTVIPNEVVSVTVTKKSLENIYDSETDNVSIKLTETTVNMDRATLKNIIEQMNGSDLKLVVDKHQDALESMNKAQKDTLKGMKNPKLIDAYFISGGIRITDFKGGSVEIKVPYSDKKRVRAWYIDDNGKKEKVPVKYDGKTAVLTISHFSHYVIEEDSSNNVKPAHVKKTLDKVIYVRSIKYSKKTGTKITFNKVSGADGYYVYGNRCNTDKVYKFKKLATLKGNDNTVFVHKKTAKNTFYKYYIRAYKVVDGKRVTISTSKEIHFVTDVKGYKYGNPTKVALSSKKCTLNKGKTFNLKNRVKVYSSKKVLLHTDKVRYVSSDSRVAKVNSRGRITAEKAGSCNIYAIAQNGRAAKITVTVK